jgi:hypothetical protein
MKKDKLFDLEDVFLSSHPQGFESESMKEISKKHKFPQTVNFVHDVLSLDKFEDIEQITEDIIRVVSKSSMVSLFEKPKFRDGLREMEYGDRIEYIEALKELIHGNEEKGFNRMVKVLKEYKLAKWTLISVFRCYYYPNTDLLIKPTTTKEIIKTFELEDIKYHPTPTYEFYKKYRSYISEMAKEVDSSLSPSLAAFTGFLMFTM